MTRKRRGIESLPVEITIKLLKEKNFPLPGCIKLFCMFQVQNYLKTKALLKTFI